MNRLLSTQTARPWHDCPPCASCGAFVAVPVREADARFYPPKEGVANLFCPACGVGFVGFPGQVAQAERAQAAWDAECEREAEALQNARRERLEAEKVARLAEGRW